MREANADRRLTPLGRRIGLVDDARWGRYQADESAREALFRLLSATRTRLDDAPEALLDKLGGRPRDRSFLFVELLRRPEITVEDLAPVCPALAEAAPDVAREVETRIKYAGYLDRQADLAARATTRETASLPPDLDYAHIPGLSREVVEKLTKIAPRSLAQAGRVSGVTPAALACLEVYLRKHAARPSPLSNPAV